MIKVSNLDSGAKEMMAITTMTVTMTKLVRNPAESTVTLTLNSSLIERLFDVLHWNVASTNFFFDCAIRGSE